MLEPVSHDVWWSSQQGVAAVFTRNIKCMFDCHQRLSVRWKLDSLNLFKSVERRWTNRRDMFREAEIRWDYDTDRWWSTATKQSRTVFQAGPLWTLSCACSTWVCLLSWLAVHSYKIATFCYTGHLVNASALSALLLAWTCAAIFCITQILPNLFGRVFVFRAAVLLEVLVLWTDMT